MKKFSIQCFILVIELAFIVRGAIGLILTGMILYARTTHSKVFHEYFHTMEMPLLLSMFEIANEVTPWLFIVFEIVVAGIFFYLLGTRKWKQVRTIVKEKMFNKEEVGFLLFLTIISTFCIMISKISGDNIPGFLVFVPLCILLLWDFFLRKAALYYLTKREKYGIKLHYKKSSY